MVGYMTMYTVAKWCRAFNDFIFDHKVGESGVVKTEFGYHYIEILSQKGTLLRTK